MLVTPHGFTALHPPVRCPAVKKWSVCITAPMGATQPARFSAGVAMGVARRWYGSSWAYCKQRLQEESGYWNRRLGRWLGQSRVKRSGMDDPAESRLVVLCTGKGQPHAEYGDSPSYPLPPPPPMSSSGDAVPQSLLEKSHVEFGHPSELEPRSQTQPKQDQTQQSQCQQLFFMCLSTREEIWEDGVGG